MANSPYIVETVAQRQARAALLDVLCAEFSALPRAAFDAMRRLLEDGIEVHEGRISVRCPALRGSASRPLRELRAQGWLGRRIAGAYEVLKPTPLPDIRAAGTELHVVRQHQPMTFQDGVHVARARAVAAVDAASAGLPSAAYVVARFIAARTNAHGQVWVPSFRNIAAQLGISRDTVRRSMRKASALMARVGGADAARGLCASWTRPRWAPPPLRCGSQERSRCRCSAVAVGCRSLGCEPSWWGREGGCKTVPFAENRGSTLVIDVDRRLSVSEGAHEAESILSAV